MYIFTGFAIGFIMRPLGAVILVTLVIDMSGKTRWPQ